VDRALSAVCEREPAAADGEGYHVSAQFRVYSFCWLPCPAVAANPQLQRADPRLRVRLLLTSTRNPPKPATCLEAIPTAPRRSNPTWEPTPDNGQANHTILSPPYNWSVENYWTLWRAKRDQVTGNFAGTTTEIIQWAACKWGIDEDTIRAAAVMESYWHMSDLGDVCGPPGEASYGLLQIKNEDCSGTVIHWRLSAYQCSRRR
jgi:hypothetical protein